MATAFLNMPVHTSLGCRGSWYRCHQSQVVGRFMALNYFRFPLELVIPRGWPESTSETLIAHGEPRALPTVPLGPASRVPL